MRRHGNTAEWGVTGSPTNLQDNEVWMGVPERDSDSDYEIGYKQVR